MFRWRRNKYKVIGVLGGILFGSVAVSAVVQAKLCEDNQYILLQGGDAGSLGAENGVALINHDGEYCTTLDISTTWFQEPAIISEDAILLEHRNGMVIPYSVFNNQELGEYPFPETSVRSIDGYYGVYDNEKGSFDVYDETGSVRYHMEFFAKTGEYASMNLVPLKDGFAAAAADGEKGCGVLFDEEGNAIRELSEEISKKICGIYGAGQGNAILGNYICDEQSVWDMDGNEILRGSRISVFTGKTYGYFEMELGLIDVGKFALVSLEDGTVQLLNSDLEPIEYRGGMESPDASICYGNYVRGGVYEELGGRECVGFVKDGKGEMQPYGMENGKAYILTDGILFTLLEVEMEEGEYPYLYNKNYLVTGRAVQDENEEGETSVFTVYKNPEGEEVYSVKTMYMMDQIQLSENLLYLEDSESEGYRQQGTLYNEKDEIVDKLKYGLAWKGEYWYTVRGIYQGFVNEKGEWEAKFNLNWKE
ncbi:MAG: hypothetical protein Q4B26_09575 [Eubacteriales bacterium]|nr:hypothetical protein [Eubacteriales bacterium]